MTNNQNEKESEVSKFQNLGINLNSNIDMFKKIFNDDNTICYRYFENSISTIKCCVVYIDGMVNNETLNENVIKPIVNKSRYEYKEDGNIIEFLKKKVLIINEVEKSSNIDDLINYILYGDSILLIDGSSEALTLNTKGWATRAILEPKSETILRGPREGFNESIIINLSLIRRKIQSKDLKFKYKQIGKITKTKTCICYIEGLAEPKIINELEKRLDEIEIDGVMDSGYIEELIKDNPLSPFKTINSTERPDVVAGKLLQGRIAVICDGSPVVLTLPFVFQEYFKVNEDYYDSFLLATFNRIIRYISAFLATSVPAIYVAFTTYHQELIPTQLIISIYSAREGVPFPTILEAILMLFTFEVLREAGIRLPKYVGQSVSIVGALVLGEAAVRASIVSAPMIIVTGITGISSFLTPNILPALIVVRIIFLILASFMGLYGYTMGVIGLFIHLMSIKSFGVNYMASISSFKNEDIKDTTLRVPWWYMNHKMSIKAKKVIQSRNQRSSK